MVLSVFGVRLFELQGLDPKAYAKLADAQGLVTVPLPATRGEITDRNGVPLAETVTGMMVVADPFRTRDNAEPIARILATRLGLDYADRYKERIGRVTVKDIQDVAAKYFPPDSFSLVTVGEIK